MALEADGNLSEKETASLQPDCYIFNRGGGMCLKSCRRRQVALLLLLVTPESNAVLHHRISLSLFEGGHRKLFPQRGRTSCFANEPNSDGEKRNDFQQGFIHKSQKQPLFT